MKNQNKMKETKKSIRSSDEIIHEFADWGIMQIFKKLDYQMILPSGDRCINCGSENMTSDDPKMYNCLDCGCSHKKPTNKNT